MTRRTAVAGLVAALLFGTTSAATAASSTSDTVTPGDAYRRTELYVGCSKPDATVVTPAEFELFLDKEVTPAFPDGLTWLPACGQWRGGKEDSYVLILLYHRATETPTGTSRRSAPTTSTSSSNSRFCARTARSTSRSDPHSLTPAAESLVPLRYGDRS